MNSKSAINPTMMKRALTWARRSARAGEVPVGAVLVKSGKVVAESGNLTRKMTDPTAHAEIIVLQKASKKLKNERFLDTELYVSKEPCAMCAGAIVQARIPVVVFGAYDAKMGACGSVLTVLPNKKLNHRPKVEGGVLGPEAAKILQSFFKRKRKGRGSVSS